jgi:hypothetical protein
MRVRRTHSVAVMVAAGTLVVWLTLSGHQAARSADEAAQATLTEDEARTLGAEAYVYGFPLVLMDITRQVHLGYSKDGKSRARPNQFIHSRTFPDPTFTSVVSPNADTLYSNAWLDLSIEPILISIPEMGKRYYLMQFLDAWSNTFACPGTRTTGNGKGEFAVVGPGWKGEVPAGVQVLRSPTNMVWLIGRTQTNGKDDYAAVHAMQNKYKMTPLSARGKNYVPPENAGVEPGIDTKTPPVEQVTGMAASVFFARLNALMNKSPPAAADAATLKRLARIGVVPGKPFEIKALNPAVAGGIEQGVRAARERLTAAAKRPQGKGANSWDMIRNLGKYGTVYPFRAVVALFALGANLPEDALYPRTRTDADGLPLSGANRYVMHFTREQLPPVEAFWSVTLYNSKQAFVENPIGRYAIGDRDRLKFDDDGSLTLYIQHESPGGARESNWLPTPKDEFNLFMRLYWPKKEALDGTWKPPAVQRLQEK